MIDDTTGRSRPGTLTAAVAILAALSATLLGIAVYHQVDLMIRTGGLAMTALPWWTTVLPTATGGTVAIVLATGLWRRRRWARPLLYAGAGGLVLDTVFVLAYLIGMSPSAEVLLAGLTFRGIRCAVAVVLVVLVRRSAVGDWFGFPVTAPEPADRRRTGGLLVGLTAVAILQAGLLLPTVLRAPVLAIPVLATYLPLVALCAVAVWTARTGRDRTLSVGLAVCGWFALELTDVALPAGWFDRAEPMGAVALLYPLTQLAGAGLAVLTVRSALPTVRQPSDRDVGVSQAG